MIMGLGKMQVRRKERSEEREKRKMRHSSFACRGRGEAGREKTPQREQRMRAKISCLSIRLSYRESEQDVTGGISRTKKEHV